MASAYERRVRLIGEIGRQQDSEPLDDLRRELLADIVPLGAELPTRPLPSFEVKSTLSLLKKARMFRTLGRKWTI